VCECVGSGARSRRPRGASLLQSSPDVANKNIQTLDGLGTANTPHPLQAAFVEEQAAQCGYCMNGILMTATVLLDKNPNPSDAEIKRALDQVLCRCGSHLRVIRAIKHAARTIQARA